MAGFYVPCPMKAGTFQKRICGAIRRYRERLGFTQEGFADEAGIHRAYYSRLERGQHNISIGTLEKICATLKVRLLDIVRDAEI